MNTNGSSDYLLAGAAGSGGGAGTYNKRAAEVGEGKGSASTIRARNSRAIRVQPMDSVTSLASVLCFPCTCFGGFYAVGPRSVVLNTHNGLLTSVEEDQGCHWVTPMCRQQHYVTTKEVTYRLPDTKVADRKGAPLMVSAILTYRIVDAKKAIFDVQNYRSYVEQQAQAALKQVVGEYTYYELKEEAGHIGERVCEILQKRVNVAGAEVLSVALNELNYAPEIAQGMLKKQQAESLLEARELIVKGAVDICVSAINQLEEKSNLKISNEERVKLVSNLLCVTVGEEKATPVLNV